MELRKRMIKRTIGGDTFLVPVGKAVYEANGLYFLTEVGAFIWDLLPQAQDEDEILRAVLEEYDVDEATAREDITAFLDKLKEMAILGGEL